MSTPFVSVPASPASPDGSVVTAGPFYPDVDCNRIRDELPFGDSVTHSRLVAAVRGALVGVIGELASYCGQAIADGFGTLVETRPEPQVDGVPVIEIAFLRAVQFYAGAELAETHRALSATADGQSRADAQIMTAADYRRLGLQAVRDVLGQTRIDVELI